MDNRVIDVTSEGNEGIALALKLIWPNAIGGKATHYLIAPHAWETAYYGHKECPTSHSTSLVTRPNGTPTLILLWGEEGGANKLPYPLDFGGTTQFIENWLKEVPYGPEPDHDGSNGKGWHMFTEGWGHVANLHYAIVGVQPAWAMYGK